MVSSSDRCERCGVRLTWAKTGRPKRFCSTRCRVAAHRARPVQLVIDQVDDEPASCRLCRRPLASGAVLGYCAACLPDLFAHPADHS